MNMSWSVAVIVIVVLVFLGSIALALVDVRGKVAKEEAKGKYGEQYRMLVADYGQFAKEMRDATQAMQSDLAAMLERVDSIDRMMREVG
jgi:ribosome-binding protein aMBF1 (putative translation factor)